MLLLLYSFMKATTTLLVITPLHLPELLSDAMHQILKVLGTIIELFEN